MNTLLEMYQISNTFFYLVLMFHEEYISFHRIFYHWRSIVDLIVDSSRIALSKGFRVPSSSLEK